MNFCKTAISVCVLFPAALAAQQQSGTRPWKPQDILPQTFRAAYGPTEVVWTPDSSRLTFLDPGAGDLLTVDPATAQVSVLVSHQKIDSVMNPDISEKDKDHRSRYATSSYVFAPDSAHVLFDAGGALFLFDLKSGAGRNVADSGQGSGDDPKFSPDGQSVSYVKNHNLYARSLSGSAEVNLSAVQDASVLNGEVDWVYEEELDVRSNYFWSPDSRRVAYLQAAESRVPEYPIVDWIPTHPTTDMQRYPQPGDPNPDVRVGVVAASGGATTWVKLPIRAGDDYIPRFGWLNERTVWVETLTRDHKHRNVWFADAATGNAKQMIADDDAKFLDENYDVMVLEKSGALLLTSWRDGFNHMYAYRYDRRNAMQAAVSSPSELDKGSYDVDEMEGADETRGVVFYSSNRGDPLGRQIAAAALDGSGDRPVTQGPAQQLEPGYRKGTFAPNGLAYAEEHSRTTQPPVMSVCLMSAGCRAYWQSPGVDASLAVRAPKMLQLKAPDGATLYASLLMPANATGTATVPLINNPYGGPHAQTVQDRFSPELFLDEMLTQHGYAVLHVDNEGMGMRGREFAVKAYRDFGPIQFAGQTAAIEQVLSANPQLDANRLGWWGWSWGGTFTLYAMTHSDRFKAGFAVAPVTDWRNYDSIYTERYMGLPANEEKNYHDYSVTSTARQLKGHVLIAQGTGDDNVHMQNAIQFIEQLIQGGVPYDLQLFPRKTHSIAGTEDRALLYMRLLDHFETNLKAAQ